MPVGTVTEPKPDCPDCGGTMRLIPKGRGKTKKDFWGCTEYPGCRGTRNVDPETGRPETDENPRRSMRAEMDDDPLYDDDPFADDEDEEDCPW